MPRKCQKCGKSHAMKRVVDDKYGIIDTRFRVCFECEFTLEHSDDGDLTYFQDNEYDEPTEVSA